MYFGSRYQIQAAFLFLIAAAGTIFSAILAVPSSSNNAKFASYLLINLTGPCADMYVSWIGSICEGSAEERSAIITAMGASLLSFFVHPPYPSQTSPRAPAAARTMSLPFWYPELTVFACPRLFSSSTFSRRCPTVLRLCVCSRVVLCDQRWTASRSVARGSSASLENRMEFVPTAYTLSRLSANLLTLAEFATTAYAVMFPVIALTWYLARRDKQKAIENVDEETYVVDS
jgi:hypothetical protein